MITADRTEFHNALPAGGRLIGLDVGTRTIGTALCDAGWSFASPAELIRRTKFQKDKIALAALIAAQQVRGIRSEEHTSELQSLMRISYAVFCLKKKKNPYKITK